MNKSLLLVLQLRHIMLEGVDSVGSNQLEHEIGQLHGGQVQIVEGLSRRINLLAQELSLDLVGGVGGPPDGLGGLGVSLVQSLGQLNVSYLLSQGLGNHVNDLLLGELLGAVQLKGLGNGGVVEADSLESGSHVNHVHGVGGLLELVGGHQTGRSGHSVQEPLVLPSKHGGRSHNGGPGHNVLGDLLAQTLGVVELGGRVNLGVERRHVDVSSNVVFLDCLCDSSGSLNVHVVVVEVLGLVLPANQVDHNVRVTHRLVDGLQVSQVHFQKVDHAQVSGHLEMSLGHLLSVRHHHRGSMLGQLGSQVAAQEAVGSKHGRGVAGSRRPATGTLGNQSLAGPGDVDVLGQVLERVHEPHGGGDGLERLHSTGSSQHCVVVMLVNSCCGGE
ncbi:uncharacterized protein YALI1_D32550g [Yarrowia lipolytica]|uniref:Secreted protein n=1 Tax=Yarrowia lipolytica TaxID=4952 RepID=A0A1D8NG39_YARLL|nr:hypothetical protein YALI1_D32550g [Yarrowia lipolytica]